MSFEVCTNGDYVEQLTYLLFLKMDDERRKIGDSAEVEQRLSVVTAKLSLAERPRQARNGRTFTGQLVSQGARIA